MKAEVMKDDSEVLESTWVALTMSFSALIQSDC